MNHTPGHWHTKGTIVLVTPRLIIADVDRSGKFPETALANARLIAAAPEMLAALKALMEPYEGISAMKFAPETAERIGTARAAIALAEKEGV